MASVVGSTRHWSCTTLNDGVDALLDASNNNDAESFYTHTGETTQVPRQLHHFHDFPSFGKITFFRNPGFSFETPSFLRGPTFSWDPEASDIYIYIKISHAQNITTHIRIHYCEDYSYRVCRILSDSTVDITMAIGYQWLYPKRLCTHYYPAWAQLKQAFSPAPSVSQ